MFLEVGKGRLWEGNPREEAVYQGETSSLYEAIIRSNVHVMDVKTPEVKALFAWVPIDDATLAVRVEIRFIWLRLCEKL